MHDFLYHRHHLYNVSLYFCIFMAFSILLLAVVLGILVDFLSLKSCFIITVWSFGVSWSGSSHFPWYGCDLDNLKLGNWYLALWINLLFLPFFVKTIIHVGVIVYLLCLSFYLCVRKTIFCFCSLCYFKLFLIIVDNIPYLLILIFVCVSSHFVYIPLPLFYFLKEKVLRLVPK